VNSARHRHLAIGGSVKNDAAALIEPLVVA
jgi:hypothetical protein